MSLYTGGGDDGLTGLFGNRRVPKDDLRIEAYGAVDELNSFVGLARNEVVDAEFDRCLQRIQELLFEVGADLATEGGKASLPAIEPGIAQLERWIDASEAELEPLSSFILPGGHTVAALLHVARTVSRRAERRFWSLQRAAGDVPKPIGVFLNRLSDLLFSWARRANARAGLSDTPWRRSAAKDASED
ncbi:MAG: cob(I)yrinic acid a,c-diamide adenosyltransferase [Planctomycetota bacterium]